MENDREKRDLPIKKRERERELKYLYPQTPRTATFHNDAE